MKPLLISISILLITACANLGSNTPADIGELPDGYPSQIETHLKRFLKDPYSMRDFSTGDPERSQCAIGIYGPFHGWRVPTSFNSKNSFGAYTGITTVYYWFSNGQLKGVSRAPGFCTEAAGW